MQEEQKDTSYECEVVRDEKFPFKEPGKKGLSEILDWTESLVFAITVAILILVFLFKNVGIEGMSMQDTLFEGDRVVISNLFYSPRQFDIVVINKPNFENKPFVKRIIATEGQTVNIDFSSGQVLVDSVPISEPYVKEMIHTHLYGEIAFPVTVPENSIFVMGDNRNNSTDSRSDLLGMVDERYIMGRVLLRVFPLNKMKIFL